MCLCRGGDKTEIVSKPSQVVGPGRLLCALRQQWLLCLPLELSHDVASSEDAEVALLL